MALARDGRVVLQFDDGRLNQYQNAFPILERHGLKGTFGVVTGQLGTRVGSMTREMAVNLARHGHEVHDHTLHHNPAFWGDTLNASAWGDTIRKSIGILTELGIGAQGWNQPGGAGQGWSRALRDTLAQYYNYAAGRVGLMWLRTTNDHWNLVDDPLSLGRGGVYSWGYNAAATGLERLGIRVSDETDIDRNQALLSTIRRPESAGAALELHEVLRRMTDGYEQGLTVIPVFHDVIPSDSSAWALDSLCAFVVRTGMVERTLGQVIHRLVLSAPYDRNQIPNPEFRTDRNNDGLADGWVSATCTGVLHNGARTTVYGPERGRTALRFRMRCPTGDDNVRVVINTTRIAGTGWWHTDDDYVTDTRYTDLTLGNTWSVYSDTFDVDREVDRVELAFLNIDDSLEVDSLTFIRSPLLASNVAGRSSPPATILAIPNPFGGEVSLHYTMRRRGHVCIDIFDVAGRRLRHIDAGWRGEGVHILTIPGRGLAAGVYFARLEWNGRAVATRRVVHIP